MLRDFIDQSHDAFFVNQLTANGRLVSFLEVNDVLCRQLEYTRNELLALNPYTIFRPDEQNHIDNALKTMKDEGGHLFETVLQSKQHRSFPVELGVRMFQTGRQRIMVAIARDITDRRKAQREQEFFSRQLRSLAGRLQNIREEERAMIAREIHDDLGQNLTVLKIRLALLCDRTPALREPAEPILILIDQIADRVQKISAKLRPGLLDELGLIPAIEWQSQDFSEHTGIICDCRLPAEDLPLENDMATAVFRIFQEALTNVARHAHATKVSVNLSYDQNGLILEVTDNGIGISRAQIGHFMSLGLLGMRERAMIFGGDLDIRGVPGKGTNLKLSLPVRAYKDFSN